MKTLDAPPPMNTTRPALLNLKLKFPLLCAVFVAATMFGLRADDVYWLSGSSGNWDATDNWQGGALPTEADNVIIGSGSVYINVSGTSTTASIGHGIDEVAYVTIGNGGVWMPSGTDMILPTGTTWIGNSGTGIVTVESGGVWMSSGSNANGDFLRLGENDGAYGEINVKDGGYFESSGIFVGGTGGTGVINIEAGGTMAIRNGTLYIARYDGSYGEVNIDGHFISGYNNTSVPGSYYVPVGYTAGSVGVVNLGATGIVDSGIIDIAKNASASGTVTIAGRWNVNTTGNNVIGNEGTGFLEIKDTGVLNMLKNASFVMGNSLAASGTAIISGSVINANTVYIGNKTTGENTFILNEGAHFDNTANSWFGRNPADEGSGLSTAIVNGYWYTGGYMRIAENGTSVLNIGETGVVKINSYMYLGNNGTSNSGTAMVNGYLEINDNFHLGQAGSRGDLYIGQTGTVATNVKSGAGMRITYSTPLSTASVGVDGVLNSNLYIILAHHGKSDMFVGQTGTVTAGTYIAIGQGDSHNNAITTGEIGIDNYVTSYGGTMMVDGYAKAGTYIQVGNRTYGRLDISTTGTVIAGTILRMGLATSGSTPAVGVVNVDGYLQVGTDLQNGTKGIGYLDIRSTSNVTIGGNYSQNANSTLRAELDSARRADTLYPDLSAPLFTAGGAATLSGTLHVHGDAIQNIPNFEYDADGYAKASTLTGIPVFRANGGISGDFTTVVIDGLTIPPGLPDFIRGGGLKVNEGGPVDTRYDIGYGLAWKSGVASAHGDFTVGAGYTFEADLQLTDRNLVFDSGWDGKSLVKKGEGTLILSVENAYTGATTVESGTLLFAGPVRHTIGDLTNNGVIDIRGNTGFRTLTASTLAGSGTFNMAVDLASGKGDRIVINGDATGTYRLNITGSSSLGDSMPTGDEPTITLLSIGGVNDIDYNAGGTDPNGLAFEGNFDYGVFNYAVEMQGHNIVIVNTGLDPVSFDPIKGVPGAQSVLWFDQQDNVSRRLGELRAPREQGMGLDLWARAHASSATLGGGSTEMRKSDVDMWGAEIGIDYTWRFDTDRVTAGAYIGYGSADQDFRAISSSNAGKVTGDSDILGFGGYAAWLNDSGWFANSTLSLAQYDNKFDARDGSNNSTRGDYDDRAFGVTAEIGRRIDITNGWFVEPAVQGAIVRFIRGSYTTEGSDVASQLRVHGSDATINRIRGTVRVGRTWQLAGNWFEVAVRGGAVRERSTGGEVNIGSANRWRPNLDGERFEAGFGIYWKPFDVGQVYFDYEYAGGTCYNKPWGISVGFRLSL
ncbi:outer membrane autotransporter protein [Ereboglobus sp. PH5-10]|uniref:autotransporter outer membrane beta-barrel domain-containing protein n=1 Tax=Ereboglobus sp. PH5-10 TaxID=2940629 RepID=UPI0024075034|nr:autotransporter outer membrane beta-barrel domain-containing protein [Ereboglobus sp. PH5-10]MDF9826146.1 outer membrane autotransporter protein [Ereboglobus sp. PH5-10]